jgi:hypothetical protein
MNIPLLRSGDVWKQAEGHKHFVSTRRSRYTIDLFSQRRDDQIDGVKSADFSRFFREPDARLKSVL